MVAVLNFENFFLKKKEKRNLTLSKLVAKLSVVLKVEKQITRDYVTHY